MPIYEYECQACGHQFESTQRITEDPLKDCPTCKKPALQRLISATAFHLKGSGWYKDGYNKTGKERTENQVGDRLQKAIGDDKKKTAEASAPSAAPVAASAGESTGGSSDTNSTSSSSTATSGSGSST